MHKKSFLIHNKHEKNKKNKFNKYENQAQHSHPHLLLHLIHQSPHGHFQFPLHHLLQKHFLHL